MDQMTSAPEAEIKSVVEPRETPIETEGYASTAKIKAPLTDEDWANMDKPKVLIVGAGIGGLFLGNLLQKADIPFTIFERAHEVKPFGSCMSLGANVATLFEQIGIQEDFAKIGKPALGLEVLNDDLTPSFYIDGSKRKKYSGAEEYLIARPDFYDLLLRQVPKEHILMGKKVLSFEQNDLGVMIRCNDGTTHHGDILVGADGAHSAVRQHLFKILKAKNLLPSSDEGEMPFDWVCLVGQTEVLDPEEFPEMKLPHTRFTSVVKNEFTWAQATTIKNTICWGVSEQLHSKTFMKNDAFRNSEWGPEAAEEMCKQVRHFKVPAGKGNLTMGDLIDRTPKHLISKVMLEEKVCSAWFGGRTVLLGDACHKLNPAGGAGALSAIHDAVTLANWISTLHKPTLADIETIFAEYQAERLPVAKEAMKTAKFIKSKDGKSLVSSLSRLLFSHMPRWLLRLLVIKMMAPRPQVSFLPLVEDKGTKKPLYQPSLVKTLAIHKARAAKNQAEPPSSEPTVAI